MEKSIEKLFYQTEEAEKNSSPLRIPKSYDAINEIEELLLSSLDGEKKSASYSSAICTANCWHKKNSMRLKEG